MRLSEQSPSLLVNDPEIIANAFSTFFLTAADNLHLRQWGRDCVLPLLKDAFS
jgi:hypothetical protein